jgi:Family of unknown function (DUF6069)
MSNHTQRRIATVFLTPAAALATWAVARRAGIDFDVSTGSGKVGAVDVVVAAVVGALAAWLTARAFEHRSRRPRAWWGFTASTALSASLIEPSWLAEGWDVFGLTLLHFVTAVVVISGFLATIPIRRCEPVGTQIQTAPGSSARPR